jgi:excisionase family DNA binding protein
MIPAMSDSQSTATDAHGSVAPFSVADAAELLGVSPATVRAHLRQGTLAGEKIGQQWVVYLAGTPASDTPAPTDPGTGQDRLVATAPAPMPAPAASGVTVLVLTWLIRLVRRLRAASQDRFGG